MASRTVRTVIFFFVSHFLKRIEIYEEREKNTSVELIYQHSIYSKLIHDDECGHTIRIKQTQTNT